MTELQLQAEVQKLAALTRAAYLIERKGKAREFDIPVGGLDDLVDAARQASHNGGGNHHAGGDGNGAQDAGSNGTAAAERLERLRESAKELIEADDVLAEVADAIRQMGYAGDCTPVLNVYVAVSSRMLAKPTNLQLGGESAIGKNHTVTTAVRLIPDEAMYRLSAASPKALIYSDEDFQHRTVVLAEIDSLPTEGSAASLLRSIIEDGAVSYDVVEKDESGKFVTRHITKQGPTNLVTTGVDGLEHQTATRVLAVTLSDSPEQTKHVVDAIAMEATGEAKEPPADLIARHQDFQRWLAAQSTPAVVVPFAKDLAAKIPTEEVRMRRDFKQLLAVIRTVALINRAHRQTDAQGRIVANFADYQWGRVLLNDIFKSITGGGATPAVRETCAEFHDDDEELSEADLAARLKRTKSTTHYRVKRALEGGWLVNRESRKGYPYRLALGAPLPDASVLPTREELEKAFEQSKPLGGEGESATPFEWFLGFEHLFEHLETTGAEGETRTPFECSNGFQDHGREEEEIDRRAAADAGDPPNGRGFIACQRCGREHALDGKPFFCISCRDVLPMGPVRWVQ